MELIKRRQFPSWALFCYKELAISSTNEQPPSLLALMSRNAILLAPFKVAGGYKGMLIATEEASNQWVEFTMPDGAIKELFVPEVSTKLVAEDNFTLRGR